MVVVGGKTDDVVEGADVTTVPPSDNTNVVTEFPGKSMPNEPPFTDRVLFWMGATLVVCHTSAEPPVKPRTLMFACFAPPVSIITMFLSFVEA